MTAMQLRLEVLGGDGSSVALADAGRRQFLTTNVGSHVRDEPDDPCGSRARRAASIELAAPGWKNAIASRGCQNPGHIVGRTLLLLGQRPTATIVSRQS